MEYQKINLLNDPTNQSSRFRARNCVEINDESWGTYSVIMTLNLKLKW